VSLLASLRLDLELARRGYRRYAAYPAATLAGVFTNTVFGFLRVYVLLAMYAQRDDVGGYDATDAVTYTWLTQALLMSVSMWGYDFANRIRSGDIASDLVRPVDPLRAGLAFDLGRAWYHLVFRGVPPFVLGSFFFPLRLPDSVLTWAAFALSVTLAVVASYAWRTIYNGAAFWLTEIRGVGTIALIASNLLSGFIIPVRFFPDWLATIANATPFPSMIQAPVDVFVGASSGVDAAIVLGVQLAWAVALLAGARATLALGVRRLVVQGG
jgi:ABC-2 type transport system permease protein